MKLDSIDKGNAFDWGKTSEDYAKYRDIYPPEFYAKVLERGLCRDGQRILDIGTGTGVLPRNFYRYGGAWTGTDISENQIEQAKKLAAAEQMDIRFYTCPAEQIAEPDGTFDVITACQCIWYPDHTLLAPNCARMLKKGGKMLILYMAWLPFEDEIAGKSEDIIRKYNPDWSGGGETRKPMWVPDEYGAYFDVTHREEFDLMVPFTRESWHGRMRACRGVGASMSEGTLRLWEKDHWQMLEETAPAQFHILHYAAMAELTVRE